MSEMIQEQRPQSSEDKNQRVSKKDKIDILRECIKSEMSLDDILKSLNISRRKFNDLYYDLSQTDRTYYQIKNPETIKGIKLNKRGGFYISSGHIELLGLQDVFNIQSSITLERHENKIIVSLDTNSESESTPAE